MSAEPTCRLSIVIVAYNEAEALERGLPPLLPELEPGDELIISDNASTDGTAEVAARIAPGAIVVSRPSNDGFPAAANDGAQAASGDVLVLLNPDTIVRPGFRAAITRSWREGDGWDAWMGLVTMNEGGRINTSGGVTHFTGISWAGQIGKPVEEAPHRVEEVSFVSGACLAIARERWMEVGAMPGEFFLYFDDVDLSFRLRLEGGRVAVDPGVRVDHRYEFSKGGRKWRMLERNRWATVLRCYPAPLLMLVLPGLVATELAVLAVAVRNGWGRQKLLATGDIIVRLPRVLRERRAIQARRRVSSREFARWLTPDLDSPYLGWPSRSRPLRVALRVYWRFVLTILRAFE